MTRTAQLWTLAALGMLALGCLLASLLAGSASLPLGRALAALGGGGDELAATIVRTIRLPRSVSAFAVGSLLGLAGVLLQALFRNPLADPFVLGVSGGASVGALAGMLAGLTLGGLEWTATGGALCVGLLVLWMGSGGDSGRLLLSGVVLASACGAVISVLLAIADNGQLRGMVFWLAGDLGWAQHPWFDLAASGTALLAALLGGRALNVLAAGELRSAVLGLDAPTRPAVRIPDRRRADIARSARGRPGRLRRPGGPASGASGASYFRSSPGRPRRSAVWRRAAVPRGHRQPYYCCAAATPGRGNHRVDRRAGVPVAAAAAAGTLALAPAVLKRKGCNVLRRPASPAISSQGVPRLPGALGIRGNRQDAPHGAA